MGNLLCRIKKVSIAFRLHAHKQECEPGRIAQPSGAVKSCTPTKALVPLEGHRTSIFIGKVTAGMLLNSLRADSGREILSECKVAGLSCQLASKRHDDMGQKLVGCFSNFLGNGVCVCVFVLQARQTHLSFKRVRSQECVTPLKVGQRAGDDSVLTTGLATGKDTCKVKISPPKRFMQLGSANPFSPAA